MLLVSTNETRQTRVGTRDFIAMAKNKPTPGLQYQPVGGQCSDALAQHEPSGYRRERELVAAHT
jgi:hypothetical protein